MRGLLIVQSLLMLTKGNPELEYIDKVFEKSGCLDAIEDCQTHANIDVYNLAQKVLKLHDEIFEETPEGNQSLQGE